jgi:hypothetical protein
MDDSKGRLDQIPARRDVAFIKPGCHLVFDLTGLGHLSGTGLCMLLANMAMAPPADIWGPGQEPSPPAPQEVLLGGRAILVLVAR